MDLNPLAPMRKTEERHTEVHDNSSKAINVYHSKSNAYPEYTNIQLQIMGFPQHKSTTRLAMGCYIELPISRLFLGAFSMGLGTLESSWKIFPTSIPLQLYDEKALLNIKRSLGIKIILLGIKQA